jgi:hypothetical protein
MRSSIRAPPSNASYAFKASILTLIAALRTEGDSYTGQKYLGLYPLIENIRWTGGSRGLGISTGAKTAAPVATFVRSGVTL